jgi:putative endonuclease
MKNQALGARGEDDVMKYLQQRGCIILDRNWRIKEGEIDLVAQSPDGEIIFVEVKSRSSRKFGDPLEAVNPVKAQRLQRLALAWLVTHSAFGRPFRIDCAGVLYSIDGRNEIDYREGVL